MGGGDWTPGTCPSALQGLLGKDDLTACEFRTAQDVTLWPLELVAANYFSYAPDLPLVRRQHEMIATMVSVTNRCHY